MIDSYYAGGKLEFEDDNRPENVGKHSMVVKELIRTTTVKRMTKVQVMEIIRCFTRYSYIFQ